MLKYKTPASDKNFWATKSITLKVNDANGTEYKLSKSNCGNLLISKIKFNNNNDDSIEVKIVSSDRIILK